MKHYYNTNHEEGEELTTSEKHNKKQEEWLLTIFQEKPTTYFSREDIEQISGLKEGSVSRSLANLTEDYKIEKTHNMRISSYNKKVHTWILSGHNAYPMPEHLINEEPEPEPKPKRLKLMTKPEQMKMFDKTVDYAMGGEN